MCVLLHVSSAWSVHGCRASCFEEREITTNMNSHSAITSLWTCTHHLPFSNLRKLMSLGMRAVSSGCSITFPSVVILLTLPPISPS